MPAAAVTGGPVLPTAARRLRGAHSEIVLDADFLAGFGTLAVPGELWLTRPVELLTFSQVQILDVTGPLLVFATANDIASNKVPPYAIRVVSQAGGAVASSSGWGCWPTRSRRTVLRWTR